jgi:hypothetical protein
MKQITLIALVLLTGSRAMAVKQPAGAGYKNEYNNPGGVEGDAVTDTESISQGHK